jgi:hypothetical protein
VVHAEYLVAADGTHSPIRRQLGIITSGSGPLPMFIVFVYFRAPWRRFVPRLGGGDAVYIENPNVSGIFMVAKGDLGVFTTTYLPSKGETIDHFTSERCREMVLDAIGTPIDLRIVDVAPWQPCAAGATGRFRRVARTNAARRARTGTPQGPLANPRRELKRQSASAVDKLTASRRPVIPCLVVQSVGQQRHGFSVPRAGFAAVFGRRSSGARRRSGRGG